MKRIVKKLLLLLGLIFVTLKLVSFTVSHLPAGDLSLRAMPAIPGGQTELNMGPLGILQGKTHWGLVNFEAGFVISEGAKNLPKLGDLGDGFAHLVWAKLPWLVLWGLLIGALLFEGAKRRRLMLETILTALVTVALAATAVGVNVLTFKPRVDELTYRGPIKDAPRVLRLVQDIREQWNDGQIALDALSAGISRLHGQIVNGASGGIPEETTNLLLISDLHDNPVGMLIAKDLTQRFEVDGVLDAGDFTDRGTAIEANILKELGDFEAPHFIVPGNHEDVEALEIMRRVEEVDIIEDEIVEVDGITILGTGDPAGYSIENSAEPGAYTAACENLLEKMTAESPDVLLVHNPEMGNCVAEYAEENDVALVFAWGHTHVPLVERRGSVIAISAGTSGAGGLKAEPPYGFGLLSFDDQTKEFVSACYFLYNGLDDLQSTSCTF